MGNSKNDKRNICSVEQSKDEEKEEKEEEKKNAVMEGKDNYFCEVRKKETKCQVAHA